MNRMADEYTYRDIGVKVEQDEENETERKGDPNILARQVPEPHEPIPITRRLESRIRRQTHALDVNIVAESTPVGETRDGNDRDGHAIVCAEPSKVAMRKFGVIEEVEHEWQDKRDEG